MIQVWVCCLLSTMSKEVLKSSHICHLSIGNDTQLLVSTFSSRSLVHKTNSEIKASYYII